MAESYWGKYWRRRSTRRTFLAGSATAVAGSAAILAGCGDDDDDGDDDNGDDGEPTQPSGETQEPSAGERGGTLRVTKAQVDDGIDPGLKVINNNEILSRIYNHTHLYKVSTNEFLFDAATGMEQPDPETIIFPLRSGMTFHHDGSAVTANDVAFSWNRFPDLLENQGSQVNEANWGFIDMVEAPDEMTVRTNLKAPSASAPVLMASTAYGIVAQALVLASANKNVQEVDAGAGPYIIEQRDASGVRLVRYPDYYKHENPSPHFVEDGPYIDAQETRIIVDRAAVKAAFLAGDLDIMPTINDRIEFEEFTGQDGIIAKEVPTTEARLIAFDNIKFTDKRARDAIVKAIDYEALVATLYAGDGLYDGPIGIALPAFALDQATLKGYREFDPTEAKRLWEESGPPVDHIRIESNQDPRATTLAEFVKTQLEQNLDASVEVLVHDTTTWVARAREPIKQWELFIVPYNASSTPELYNMTMMNPDAFAGVSWSFGTDQPNADLVAQAERVIELTEAMSTEIDPEARIGKMEELQRYILDNTLVGINMPVPGHSWLAYNSRLQNFPEDDYYLGGLSTRVHDMWIEA